MDDDASMIVAAGRLSPPARDDEKYDNASEQMPTIAVGASGQISLVYLACEHGTPTWQMRMLKIEIDREHLRPRIEQGSRDYRLVAEGFALAPLIVSADARVVHALDISGALRAYDRPVIAQRSRPARTTGLVACRFVGRGKPSRD